MVMSPLLMVMMNYRIHNRFHFLAYICIEVMRKARNESSVFMRWKICSFVYLRIQSNLFEGRIDECLMK